MSKLDLTKPLETLDGEPVTLVLNNARGKYPLLGYRGNSDGLWQWTAEGSLLVGFPNPVYDLRNVKPKPVERSAYVNVYKTSEGVLYMGVENDSREKADIRTAPPRVGCQRITLTEGQYDE